MRLFLFIFLLAGIATAQDRLADSPLGLPSQPRTGNGFAEPTRWEASKLAVSTFMYPYLKMEMDDDSIDLDSSLAYGIMVTAVGKQESVEVSLLLMTSRLDDDNSQDSLDLHMLGMEVRLIEYSQGESDVRARWDLGLAFGAAYMPSTDFMDSEVNAFGQLRSSIGLECNSFRLGLGIGALIQDSLDWGYFGMLELSYRF